MGEETTVTVESEDDTAPADGGDNIVVVGGGTGETHCSHCVEHEGRIAVLEQAMKATAAVAEEAATSAAIAEDIADSAASTAGEALAESLSADLPVEESAPATEESFEDEVEPGKHVFWRSMEELRK